MDKQNVCVIFGGASSEYEVSLVSAASVLSHMNAEKYNIYMVLISKDGRWFYYNGKAEDIPNLPDSEKWIFDRVVLSPDRGHRGLLVLKDTGVEHIAIDVAYPVLHGKNGEDGAIQGLFELAGIPYVGSGVLGSAVCMDKCMAKILFEKAGIPQAAWVELRSRSKEAVEAVEQKLGYPCFVKPSNAGSSVGITKAHNREELEKGLELAFEHDQKVLVEESINGREVECSVIGNLDAQAAEALGEITPAAEFYDYDAKYNDENSRLTIPALLPAETTAQIRAWAVEAYQLCECRGLSRVDFFVDRETGEIRLNEINTLPGFTSISMYPKLWEASGLPYDQLIDRLIGYAVEGK